LSALRPIPSSQFDPPADFAAAVEDHDLVYFCCNVGDADAQLLLLPGRPPHHHRRAVVIDAGITHKVNRLLNACVDHGLLPRDPVTGDLAPDEIALVVATHPHADHINGMPRLLSMFGKQIVEYWDSGYWHPISAFHATMAELEKRQSVYLQPASGTRRWIHQTLVTVLSPAVGLRNRFDSYGIEINNSSLSLRIDYPAARVLRRDQQRRLIERDRSVRLVLGADAQTESWAHVLTDFPQLHARDNAASRAISAATGIDHLNADVLKISHHGSNRGVNFEHIPRIDPKVTRVSCADRSRQHNFPHRVTQELVREALQSTEGLGEPRDPDWKLNLFYTADTLANQAGQLGTIAMRLRPGMRELWRLCDAHNDTSGFDLTQARRWRQPL
jgi:hypothetical protein